MPESSNLLPHISLRNAQLHAIFLAGKIGQHQWIAISDSILVRNCVRYIIKKLLIVYSPNMTGLSIMAFQHHTALMVKKLVQELKPDVKISVGGYDPNSVTEVYTH